MIYSIEFPSDFFEEEIRDDFLVDKKRKKIWACLLDLYSELKRVCDKYNIKIFAGGDSPWNNKTWGIYSVG